MVIDKISKPKSLINNRWVNRKVNIDLDISKHVFLRHQEITRSGTIHYGTSRNEESFLHWPEVESTSSSPAYLLFIYVFIFENVVVVLFLVGHSWLILRKFHIVSCFFFLSCPFCLILYILSLYISILTFIPLILNRYVQKFK